jgi:hypothetical protein
MGKLDLVSSQYAHVSLRSRANVFPYDRGRDPADAFFVQPSSTTAVGPRCCISLSSLIGPATIDLSARPRARHCASSDSFTAHLRHLEPLYGKLD